ncbi:hypothetical protein Gotri_008046, partial [Gossypium trilobum]|nr:hypothetical protein [Gossypium trilobum]
MDQRLERLEQIQKEMQDQWQAQLQDQLAKLLAGGIEKGESTVINSGDDNEDPTYPPRLYASECPSPTGYMPTKGTHY